MKKNPWLRESITTITGVKHLLSNLSVIVRTDQYTHFLQIIRPNSRTKVLDVGVSSDETLKDTNIFERLYKYQSNITAATIENPKKFNKLYPDMNVVKIYPGKKLPFKDKSFDVVTAWATLEHVGDYNSQKAFINELLRVGKKVFITTPYRGCIYEPHSGFFFLHWLPLKMFRAICAKLPNKIFWSKVSNLNPLYLSDIRRMNIKFQIKVNVYSMFKILPSHIIINN